jgi:hypothetical protein
MGFGVVSVLFDLFILGTLFLLTEKDLFPLVFVEGIVLAVCMQIFFGVPVVAFLLANVSNIILGFFGYAAVGVLYSILKWFIYVKKTGPQLEEMWLAFKERHAKSFPERPVEHVRAEFLKSSYNPLRRDGIDLTNENNWRILNWIVLWPTSAIWTVTRGLTVDFGKFLLSVFGSAYDRITKNSFEKLH